MPAPGLVTAAAAFRHSVSAARVPNSGNAPAHFRNTRRSGINRLQSFHHVPAAMIVAGARPLASAVQVHADPTLVTDLLQDTVAGGEVDVSVSQVVHALEKFRFR